MRQRPIAVTIFGILNIGIAFFQFGGLVLMRIFQHIKLPGNQAFQAIQARAAHGTLSDLNLACSAVTAVALLVAGVGLLLLQNWARIVSIVYAVADILIVLVGLPAGYRVMAAAAEQLRGGAPALLVMIVTATGFVLALVFSLAYPVLLLIFMTQSNVIKACKPEEPQPIPAPAP
jgi:hypothetical protein